MEEKDLCKTCEHYWQDFPMPLEQVISHCEILDKQSFTKSMDDVIPYPCLKCPFDSYTKKGTIMTQKEKQLLLADLCARLPYGVKFQYIICDFCEPDVLEDVDVKREQIITEEVSRYDIEEIKPYLRPMSSMTEEEKEIYSKLEINIKNSEGTLFTANCNLLQRFFASHHLDNNHLIESGLALKAPEGMYN